MPVESVEFKMQFFIMEWRIIWKWSFQRFVTHEISRFEWNLPLRVIKPTFLFGHNPLEYCLIYPSTKTKPRPYPDQNPNPDNPLRHPILGSFFFFCLKISFSLKISWSWYTLWSTSGAGWIRIYTHWPVSPLGWPLYLFIIYLHPSVNHLIITSCDFYLYLKLYVL